jgi:tetratricopeptide (TPR) repeat protein/S1-C subfamily serine protease
MRDMTYDRRPISPRVRTHILSSGWRFRPWRGVLLGMACAVHTRAAEPAGAETRPERPALIVAVERGQRPAVERLIQEGADLKARTPDGVTPLYAAAFHGRSEILRLLVAAGAEVNGRAAHGRTALFTAAAEGQVGAVEVLLSVGADPNARSDPEELAQTPLHMAAVEGQIETARRLIAAGAEVNARNSRQHITPLYLAVIAGREPMAALLREHGADPAITDVFGQTPARAAAVLAERTGRRLLDPTAERLAFDPQAVVLMAYVGLAADRQSYRGNRIAVALGDGSMIATAAHCVEDFLEARRQSTLAVPLVFSPHRGDVFEAEIVGVDPAADLAILKVRWGRHPALPLASGEEIQRAGEMLVAGYPHPEQPQTVGGVPRQLSVERLPTLRTPGSDGDRRVTLGGARFVGPGWSGSPMILPGNGRLAGVFTAKNDLRMDLRGGDLVVMQNRVGASANAIRDLVKARQLELNEPPAEGKPPQDAVQAFSAGLSWLEAQAGRPTQEGVAAAEAFVRRRPQSGLAHLLLALSSPGAVNRSPSPPGRGGSPETHYRDAIRLAPGSLMVRAAYGLYLERQDRQEEALAELAEAQRIDPGNSFVLALRLKALENLRPAEAVELGTRLTREAPDNAAYWFHFAGALRSVGRNQAALEAAQAAVRFASKEQSWYRGRLADILARCGRLDEAEACHRELLEQSPASAVFWLWYAQFLAERMPERRDDLRKALDQCESRNRPPVIPQAVLDKLRARSSPDAKVQE